MKTLIISSNGEINEVIKVCLHDHGCITTLHTQVEEAWREYQREDFAFVLVAWSSSVPDDDLNICKKIRSMNNGDNTFILLICENLDSEKVHQLIHASIDEFICMPDKPHIIRSRFAISCRLAAQRFDAIKRQQKLKESEERFSSFMRHLPGVAFMKDKDSRCVYFNETFANIFHADDSWYGLPDSHHWPAKAVEEFRKNDLKVLAGETIKTIESVPHDDGVHHWLSNKFPIYNLDGYAILVGGIAIDISERLRADQALKESEARLQTAFENIPFDVWILDRDGICLVQNSRSKKHWGIVTGKVLRNEINEEGIACHLKEQSSQALGGVVSTRIIKFNIGNKEFWIQSSVAPIQHGDIVNGLLCVHVVVTEQKNMEHQLLHSQKMEAIGRLTGGIAHDFNNLLAVILGQGELFLKRSAGLCIDEKLRKNVDSMIKAAGRASKMTKQLLAYGRKQVLQPIIINVNNIIREFSTLIPGIVGAPIRYSSELEPQVWNVLCDPEQLEQVLMNLVVNAKDSMPNGGSLDLKTANRLVSPQIAQNVKGLKAGDYIIISVADSGSGIPQEVLPHIFEPFFTTKKLGAGTGLGLATVYGIIQQSGGAIQVCSGANGSEFIIYLPACDQGKLISIDETAHSPIEEKRGRVTVLLVDDEPEVLEFLLDALTQYGYSVLTAENGEMALNIMATERHINLVISDLVMPGLSGNELRRRINDIRPGVPFIYMSGFSNNLLAEEAGVDECVLLNKPFEISDLIRHVDREILSEYNRNNENTQ